MPLSRISKVDIPPIKVESNFLHQDDGGEVHKTERQFSSAAPCPSFNDDSDYDDFPKPDLDRHNRAIWRFSIKKSDRVDAHLKLSDARESDKIEAYPNRSGIVESDTVVSHPNPSDAGIGHQWEVQGAMLHVPAPDADSQLATAYASCPLLTESHAPGLEDCRPPAPVPSHSTSDMQEGGQEECHDEKGFSNHRGRKVPGRALKGKNKQEPANSARFTDPNQDNLEESKGSYSCRAAVASVYSHEGLFRADFESSSTTQLGLDEGICVKNSFLGSWDSGSSPLEASHPVPKGQVQGPFTLSDRSFLQPPRSRPQPGHGIRPRTSRCRQPTRRCRLRRTDAPAKMKSHVRKGRQGTKRFDQRRDANIEICKVLPPPSAPFKSPPRGVPALRICASRMGGCLARKSELCPHSLFN